MSIAQVSEDVKTEITFHQTRQCCICRRPFAPDDDELQVTCDGCHAAGFRCGCVMPWQSCAICRATEQLVHGELDHALDLSWWGHDPKEVCR